MLRGGDFSSRGLGELPVGIQFFAQRNQMGLGPFQFGRSGCRTRIQFGTAFRIGGAASHGTLRLNLQSVNYLPVLRDLTLDSVAAAAALRTYLIRAALPLHPPA